MLHVSTIVTMYSYLLLLFLILKVQEAYNKYNNTICSHDAILKCNYCIRNL